MGHLFIIPKRAMTVTSPDGNRHEPLGVNPTPNTDGAVNAANQVPDQLIGPH